MDMVFRHRLLHSSKRAVILIFITCSAVAIFQIRPIENHNLNHELQQREVLRDYSLQIETGEPIGGQNEVNKGDVYLKRKRLVYRICRKLNVTIRTPTIWSYQLSEIKDLDILMCSVPQSSVQWKMAMEIWLRGLQHSKNSFKLSDGDFRKRKIRLPSPHGLASTAQFKDQIKQNLKVLFTQDPYMQVFSYYVDNVMVPCNASLQHNKLISSALNLIRNRDRDCVYDISFEEFCQFVSKKWNELRIGGMLRHCDVCGVDYDVIGKEETLEQDIMYIYNMTKAPEKPFFVGDFKKNYDFMKIETFVNKAFVRRQMIKCITPYVMFKRLWRQLQIYGLIDKSNQFPLDSKTCTTIDVPTLLNVVLEAYEKTGSSSRSNLPEAFTQAYRAVDGRFLMYLQRAYYEDFYLFDYNDRPASVFFKQGPVSEFDYFDLNDYFDLK